MEKKVFYLHSALTYKYAIVVLTLILTFLKKLGMMASAISNLRHINKRLSSVFWAIPAVFCLKGQCHEIFCFWFFSSITFPQAPDNNVRIISNFFENSRRYSQVKVHHRCQRHRWQICHRWQWHRWQIAAGINDTGGRFATGINDTGGKFFHQFPLCCWHRRQQWRRWQIATGINDTGGKFATGVIDTGGK